MADAGVVRDANRLPWLEPYPDAALEDIADTAPGPDAWCETRKAAQLLTRNMLDIFPYRNIISW